MSARTSMKIVLDNLTEAQAEAIEDMLAEWVRLGSIGASRWTAFHADGDGNFRPRILVNRIPPRVSGHVSRAEVWPNGEGGEYRIDFDRIAWRLNQARP